MMVRQKREQLYRKKATRNRIFIISCIVIILLVVLVSMTIGYSKLTPIEIFRTLVGHGTQRQQLILFQFRLPRIIITILIGIGLALSGCIIQGISRNPLADPGLLGISAGSGLMVVLYVMFLNTNSNLSIFTLPLLSLLGASVAAFMVYTLAYKKQEGIAPIRLILIGIAVHAGITALTTLLVVKLDEDQFDFIAAFQAGQIWGTNWLFVKMLLPWLCLMIPYVLSKSHTLDVLNLGDEVALGLGAHVEKQRRLLLMAAVALAACCVAVGGNIGFVGLVAPHLARRLVGPKHTILLPSCALIGGILVLLADTIGRFVIQPSAIPTGIMTAIIGAPYFIYLLVKSR